MAFEVIQGFNDSKNAPLDELRIVAVDQAAMLAIKWVYEGLVVARIDASPVELWVCTVATATNASTPFTDIGDWEEFTGTDGADGADGSVIYTGTGVPSDALGIDGDFYLDNATGNYYTKASSTWGTLQGNLLGPAGPTGPTGTAGADGDKYATTSATSVDIGAAPSTVALTVASGLSYTGGQTVIVASQAAPLVDYFTGTVSSYATTTLNLGTLTYFGTGTHTDWDVNLTGAPGQAGTNGTNGTNGAIGKAFIHVENDISLTAGKITTIEGGAWTPQIPWSASVQNDARSSSEKNATAGIIGTMTNNSIAFDGTAWHNNGRWLGLTGATGDTGATGTDSIVPGPPGADGAGVLVVDAGWLPQSDLNFEVVNPFDHATSDVYNKRIRLDTVNSVVATFTIQFPNSVAQLQDLRQVTISILNSVKQVTIICTTLGGGNFYDSFSGQAASTTLQLNNFMTDDIGSFTFTPVVLGGAIHWHVTGGVNEPAAYEATIFKVWSNIVDDTGFFTNSSNIYSSFHTPTQNGRHLIDIAAQHYNTAGIINWQYSVHFQTYDITQTTLLTTTTYNFATPEVFSAVTGGYRAHTSIVANLDTNRSYRVWLRVSRQIGVTQAASRFEGSDTFGVTYIK